MSPKIWLHPSIAAELSLCCRHEVCDLAADVDVGWKTRQRRRRRKQQQQDL
jgi:hypothetical protein